MATEEIMIGPADVYMADPDTVTWPAVDEAPGAGWTLVGKDGALNYGESGVILRRLATSNPVRTLGTTLTRKMAISEAGFQVEYPVLDMRSEALALAYGVDPEDIETVAAASGVPGTKTVTMNTSPIPFERAILVRIGQSATMGFEGNSQWQVARAAFVGTAETTFSKTAGAQVTHIWESLEPGAGQEAVQFIEQTAVALA